MSRHNYVGPRQPESRRSGSKQPTSQPTEYREEPQSPLSPPVEQFFADQSLRSRRQVPKARPRRRRQLIVLFAVVAFFAAVVFGLIMFLREVLGMNEILDYAGPGNGEVTFTVDQGAAAILIGNSLEQQDIVADSATFLSTFQAKADGKPIQPGEYEMKYQMSSAAAAEVLLEEEPGVHYAAIASGLRQTEALDILSQSAGVPRDELTELAKDPQAFGLPEQAPKLEGYLAPGEYRFEIGTSPEQMIQEMVDRTFNRLEKAGVSDPDKQYRVLTVASIVQAEAGEADYAEVAGAIENRLSPDNTETDGRIQSDATVTYGLGRKSYELTEKEKADKSNPYNTYANKGLPVGPIGSPSEDAIDAAVHPKDVPYYYWVTVNLDTGETKFSKTLEQHNKYVQQYQQWCANNEGRCN